MKPNLDRRLFLKNSLILGAVAGLPAFARANPGGAGGKKIKVGLIGCGLRGTTAIKDFSAACKILGAEAEITAVGDAFASAALKCGKPYGLAEDKCFGGVDAYRKVIDSGCEFVLDCSPPVFRAAHLEAAVDAGKHCFIEKPVAVDPVGARKVIEVGEKAKTKGLAIVTGTQRRHMASYLSNKAMIDAGAIGEIRGGVVRWNHGRVPWTRHRLPGEQDADYMMRNWGNFTQMSGDHIVEQHIHNLDVAVWFLGRLPVSALGFGGRARRKTGNQFDYFGIDFDFGDGVHIHSQCSQIPGTNMRFGEEFTGTEGTCLGGGKVTGKQVKIPEIKVDSQNGQIQEHVDLIRGVIKGEPLNHARRIAEVNLVAILGRISAYSGQMVRMADVMTRTESPHYQLALSPSAGDFHTGRVVMPVEEVVPIPGSDKEGA
jgi:myo-inositol 2-dehydrogenase/D-chiro-inositol 1-dehydrogenase